MKLALIFAASLGLLTAAHAFPVSDDFHQSDTNTPDGGWGKTWTIDGAPVFIQSNTGKKQSDGQTVAINTKASLPSGAFAISADVYAQANDRWIGIVFHYSSPGNFGAWRVKFTENSANEPTIWQLIEVRDNQSSILQQGTIQPGAELADPAPLKTWRRLSVTRAADGAYTASLGDQASGDQPTWTTGLKWTGPDQGLAGVFFSNGFVWVKSFTANTPK